MQEETEKKTGSVKPALFLRPCRSSRSHKHPEKILFKRYPYLPRGTEFLFCEPFFGAQGSRPVHPAGWTHVQLLWAGRPSRARSVAEVEVLRRPLLEPEAVLLGHALEELGGLLQHIVAGLRRVLGQVTRRPVWRRLGDVSAAAG